MSKVEIVPIGQLITRKREKCNTLKADVYSITKERGFVLSDSLHDFSIYSDDVSNYSIISKNDFAYNPSRLNIGSFALFNKEIGIISPMYVVFSCNTEIIVPQYLYYYIKSPKLLFQIDSMKEVGARFRFDFSKWWKIEIPLPHIKVQEEIVRILDSFTNLIDALNEEMSLRQKQFEYYREKLLTFDDTSLLKSINEIGTLYRGNGLQKKDFVEEGTGCIHYGQIYTKLGFCLSKPLTYVTKEIAKPLTKVRKGDLVIACTSENVEDVCKSVVWEGEEEIVTGGHACVFRHNENPRYIGYFFQTHQFFLQKKQYVYGAKVIDIKTEKLGAILIPIPPLSTQQSIVEKLDAFESLISSLKEEIALRQKQYEYYREKLLTFD